MSDSIAHIIAYPDLSAVEMAELRRAVEADPILAALFECRHEIAASIHADLSDPRAPADDRRLFALFSLVRSGRAGELEAEELEVVAAHVDRLEAALVRHPGLTRAAEDVADAAAEFSDLWDAHFDSASATSALAVEVDRAAVVGDELGADGEMAEEGRITPSRDRKKKRRSAAAPRRGVASPVRSASVPRHGTTRTKRSAARPTWSAASSRRGGAYRWAVRTAIAVSVVVFAIVLAEVVGRDSDELTVATSLGETRTVELGLGSRVRLLESSKLTYVDPQAALIRRAELAGRAFFEIAPDDRGFIVETSTARVTVLGTTFGVDAQEAQTEVVLTEGRVTLARRQKLDDLVVLEPGQMSRVVAGAGPTPPTDVDVLRSLSWTGLFIFQSTPLDDIAALLSDHFAVLIKVDEALTDERVTGTFEQDQSLREILGIIASAVGAAIQPDPAGGYVLTHP